MRFPSFLICGRSYSKGIAYFFPAKSMDGYIAHDALERHGDESRVAYNPMKQSFSCLKAFFRKQQGFLYSLNPITRLFGRFNNA